MLADQLQWVEGHVRRMDGDLQAAEICFLEARRGFTSAGEVAHAAAVGLDLSEICLEQGRTHDAVSWTLGSIPVFELFEYHREAVAALQMLNDVASKEQITLEVIRAVRGLLAEIAQQPMLVFQERS